MRILHVFRAPVGGLFRHVSDLAKEQAARGHEVGVFCDATFAGERNEKLLDELAPHLSLGVERVPMRRNPHGSDVVAMLRLKAFARESAVDVLHGHGSKGGVYARAGAVLRKRGPIRAYTPHGGSLNYKPGTSVHRAYMAVERLMERGTDLFLFESRYIADRFRAYVCETQALARIVLNGLYPEELTPVQPEPGASDFLYIGEFRFAKGIDTLLAALSALDRSTRRRPTLTLVGQGPDEVALRSQTEALGLVGQVTFRKPMAAREAFRLARVMLVPSRFESLPYVVIEAAGARMPIISTDVGGIPEIFGSESGRLIPPDDVEALATAMASAMATSDAKLREPAARLQAHIDENFTVAKMTTTVLDAYAEAAQLRRSDAAALVSTPSRQGAGR
jgi:glycosyltransferase involved in cell wall biosynthesis